MKEVNLCGTYALNLNGFRDRPIQSIPYFKQFFAPAAFLISCDLHLYNPYSGALDAVPLNPPIRLVPMQSILVVVSLEKIRLLGSKASSALSLSVCRVATLH